MMAKRTTRQQVWLTPEYTSVRSLTCEVRSSTTGMNGRPLKVAFTIQSESDVMASVLHASEVVDENPLIVGEHASQLNQQAIDLTPIAFYGLGHGYFLFQVFSLPSDVRA